MPLTALLPGVLSLPYSLPDKNRACSGASCHQDLVVAGRQPNGWLLPGQGAAAGQHLTLQYIAGLEACQAACRRWSSPLSAASQCAGGHASDRTGQR